MLKLKVKQWFFEGVRLNKEAPEELKRVLLNGHPNLDAFVEKIAKQIDDADKVLQKRGMILKEKTMQDFVYDMTSFFIKGFEGEAKRRYESDLERLARRAEADKIKEMDDTLSGNAQGEFKEAGVITNEEIDKQREVALKKRDAEIQKQKRF